MRLIAGRYRVEGTLGTGGAGEVLHVVEQGSRRRLALKRLHVAGTEARRRRGDELRFRREFHVLASLRHPCIVRAHDYGVDARGPWYTMELLDGPDLRSAAPLPPAEACRILRDVAAGLAHLHARRLIHRDVAPRNVRAPSGGHARLLDFGVLSTMGVPRDVAGTPPCIAPEALRRLPLDQRVDLYSLGALGYFLLTGRYPYPARSVDELETLWRERPAPPSRHSPATSAALDALIMSLLSLDPLGRPSSAGEVVDRLGGIADVGPAPGSSPDRATFGSPVLAGRADELRAIEAAVTSATGGTGRALVIEGASGIGKSRLLRELELFAKTRGATVVVAAGESAGRGPYGVMQEISRAIFEAAPPGALEAAAPFAPALIRVLPAFASRFPHASPARLSGDPAEDRLQVHQATVSWLLAVASRRPLALLVDDAQRSDEGSASVLASIAHVARQHPILAGVVVRSDEPVRAETAFQVIGDAAQRLELRGLDAKQVGRMMRSLFGEVPNVERLAERMHAVAGGNPLQLTELVHHLVENGLIRSVEGMWTLPAELRRRDLPDSLTEALDARVRALAKPARQLGQVLSLHEGEAPLEVCVAAMDADEERAFAALDDLMAQDVIVGSGYRYRFRHDGLRDAFRRSIDPRRLPRIHLTLGRALLGEGERDDVSGRRRTAGDAEIGWHLLRGGDAARGARLLARAGTRLFEAQSFSDAIAPLEDSLAALEELGHPPRGCLELRHMLLVSGVMADRGVVLRHADRTLALLRRYSGADDAAMLGRLLGRHAGLVLAVLWALVRWAFTWPSRRGPNPFAALSRFFVATTYAATAYSLSFDFRRTKLLVDGVAPFVVAKRRVLYAAYLMAQNFCDLPLGRFATVRGRAEEAIRIAETDRLTPIAPVDRAHGIGAALYMITATHVMDQDPAFETYAARLDRMGLRFFAAAARVARALYHRMRGEEEAARALDAQAEETFIGLGSVWILESQRVWASSLGYGLTRDLLGLRRSIDALVRLTDDGYRLESLAELARGEYLRERGELDAALRAIAAALELAPPGNGFIHQAALCARAETLLALERPGDAMRAADDAIALALDPDTGRVAWRLRAQRARSLAKAALGDPRAAATELDGSIEEASAIGSPTLSGMLHEARARVSLLLGDRTAYGQHRDETQRCFRPTENPALVARADRVLEASRTDRQPIS